MRGDEVERRRREDFDFLVGFGEDIEGFFRRFGGVLERVFGEDDVERFLRESLVFLVNLGDDRELRRRGGVRDLIFVFGDDLEFFLVVLDLGGCFGEDLELLFFLGEGFLFLFDEFDLFRLGRVRGVGVLGLGEELELFCVLGVVLGLFLILGDELDLLRRGEGRDLLSIFGDDLE